MPVYAYRCVNCNGYVEERRAFGDHVTACPNCGGALRQVYHSFRFRFRGRNWKPYDLTTAEGEETVKEEMCYG